MADHPQPGAVVFVSDPARVAAFYRDVADMTVVHADPQHQVLQIPGLQLTVHAIRGADPVAEPAQPREDSYLKLCFPVASIAAARVTAAARGGLIRPVEAEWQARGFRACDGHDPEGNVIQVREKAS